MAKFDPTFADESILKEGGSFRLPPYFFQPSRVEGEGNQVMTAKSTIIVDYGHRAIHTIGFVTSINSILFTILVLILKEAIFLNYLK